jgi:hypothetical protein
MRAAIEAAPYKHPKIAVSAIATINREDFATALERAIERSKQPMKLLNGPAPPELPASELKKPFPNYRNNFRRY